MPLELFSPNQLTYFLHIPKTAGTSFSQLLDQLVPPHTIVPAKLWSQLLPILPYDWRPAQLLRGHFGYGIHRNIPKKVMYLTFLRDPIERSISSYHHLCVDYEHSGWVHASSMVDPLKGLNNLLQEPSLSYLFDNRQTAHLGFDLDVLSKINITDQTPFIVETSLRYQNNHEEVFLHAQEHLYSFPWFGIQEYYQQSLNLLSFTFRISLPKQQEKLMVLPGRPKTSTFSQKEITELRQRNTYDQHLYDHAVTIFKQRYDDMLETLKTTASTVKDTSMDFDSDEAVYQALQEYLHSQ